MAANLTSQLHVVRGYAGVCVLTSVSQVYMTEYCGESVKFSYCIREPELIRAHRPAGYECVAGSRARYVLTECHGIETYFCY